MNRGLLIKGVREAWLMTVLTGLGLMAFETVVAYTFWSYRDMLTSDLMQIDFLKNAISTLVGADTSRAFGPDALSALAWTHPIVLALAWAQAITLCTRIPAGEIDRGTVDILLGLPISRWELYICETLVLLGGGLVLVALALGGDTLGNLPVPIEDRLKVANKIMTLCNFYAIYLTVGAFSFFVSSLCDRRGRAIGIVFAVLLVQFLWNFLAPYWQPARDFNFLTFLSYYQPMPILINGIFPFKNILVLAGIAIPLWVAGGIILSRRDVCTV